MKVIILAAGLGSRLDRSEERLPKPLTKLVNHKSILQFQLENLSSILSLDQVFIVVGYQKEAIMDLFPDLVYIYNPAFAQENTSKSLLRALKKINEDLLWLNGDVIFHPTVIKKVLDWNRTSMVVNQLSVGEEEIKYRTNGQGHILEVSKSVKQPEGEALGINFYKQEDLALLKIQLQQCLPTDYFEKGIEQCIQNHQIVYAVPVDPGVCTEIDSQEDLTKANQMLRQWKL